MKYKRLGLIIGAVALILLVPLIAMPFTNAVNWTLFDFLVAGGLLLGTGLALELVMRITKKVRSRVVISILILAVLALVWAELAVGIFGTAISGN